MKEVLDQGRDVLAAVAERRDDEVDDVEPIEEVFAELPLPDALAEVAVGGGNDAHVQTHRGVVGADLLQLAGFEEPQQHALHAQGHLADLVEEDRAAIAHLELAGLVAVGAGETALHVAEELRLEERLGNAGAVDRHKGLARPVGTVVDGSGDQLLADTALAGDEDLGVGQRNPFNLLPELRHLSTVANEIRVQMSHSAKPRRAPEPVIGAAGR